MPTADRISHGAKPVFVDPTGRRPRRVAVGIAASLAAFVAFVATTAASATDLGAHHAGWEREPGARVTTVADR